MTINAENDPPLLLEFGADSATSVSRKALREIAGRLRLTESQTVLYALVRLRDEVMNDEANDELAPLTAAQQERIRRAAPQRRGRVLDTLLR